jgi:mono/diheme cytochrome c family protein
MVEPLKYRIIKSTRLGEKNSRQESGNSVLHFSKYVTYYLLTAANRHHTAAGKNTGKYMRQILTLALALAISTPAFAADIEKGKALFLARCSTCHGNTGLGDGPVAASLPAEMKPRDLSKGEFKVVKDDASMKDLITKGGAAFGLNPLMPPQAGLSDDDFANLIAFVRSLKK